MYGTENVIIVPTGGIQQHSRLRPLGQMLKTRFWFACSQKGADFALPAHEDRHKLERHSCPPDASVENISRYGLL